MKKNIGFTLIELLATIVILGILFGLGIPLLTSTVSRNKQKMYVNDAKKLVSKVEYTLKSANSTIEKPDQGDCIIVSMAYLSGNDFRTSPNEGEYVRDASYVVVKNNDNGNLEYSVAIVEKLKNGSYIGIPLIRSESLQSYNSTKYVKNIGNNELVRVKNNLQTNYINNQLGSKAEPEYVSAIEHIYHDVAMDDDASIGGLASPEIINAVLRSTSGKPFNSLDTTLSLTVEDKDTALSDLSVYISDKKYDESAAIKEKYGDKNTFIKKFEFDKMGYDYYKKPNVTLYIVVKDPDGNTGKVKLDYKLHTNEPPVFGEETKLLRRPVDSVNMGTALLNLAISDDIDTNDKIQVCYSEKVTDTAKTCDKYEKYSELIKSDIYHTFNQNKCALNGQEYSLKVFAKDSLGATSEITLPYKLHTDAAPKFASKKPVDIQSTETSFNSLNVRVVVNGSDDVTSDSNLRVRIREGSTNEIYPYNQEGIMFKLSGEYDGKPRNITVSLIDECNHETAYTPITYNVYKNKAPRVKNISITSNGYGCKNVEKCPVETAGGKLNATVNFDVFDDIDYKDVDDKILVCVSENKADCNNSANFKKYSNYKEGYEYTFSGTYDGNTRNLYVIAKDSYGESNYSISSGVDSENHKTYKVYKNKAPSIDKFDLVSNLESFTATSSLNVRIYLDASDDMEDMNEMKYSIETEGYNENVKIKSLENYDNVEGIPYRIAGEYDGGKRKIIFKVYDKYSLAATKTVEYEVYTNKPPEIYYVDVGDGESGAQTTKDNDFNIVPASDCETNYKCPFIKRDAEGNIISNKNAEVNLIFEVLDDVDKISDDGDDEESEFVSGDMKICISENESDCRDTNSKNYILYKDYLSGDQTYTFNKGKQNPYLGETKTLHIFVLDSGGLVTHVSKKYTLYNANPPQLLDKEATESEASEGDELYPNIQSDVNVEFRGDEAEGKNYNSVDAIYKVLAVDEYEDSVNLEVNICYKRANSNDNYTCTGYKPYAEEFPIHFNAPSYNGQEYTIYSIVRNSLGLTSTSKAITYKIHNDEAPTIYDINATYQNGMGEAVEEDSTLPMSLNGYVTGPWNTVTGNYIKVAIIARDAYDTYKICVTKVDDVNTCTFIGKQDGSGFDGTDQKSGLVYFVEPEHLYYISDTKITKDVYYAFVEDSHGNKSEGMEFIASPYVECRSPESVVEKTEYTLDNTKPNNIAISGKRCGSKGGQCYYGAPKTSDEEDEEEEDPGEETGEEDLSGVVEDTTGILAYYKKRLFYKDKFNPSKSCIGRDDSGNEQVEDYTANCSFKDCFYNANSSSDNKYLTKAIGLTKHTFPREKYETFNYIDEETGETLVEKTKEYYIVYTTSYDSLSDRIVLEPTNEYVFPGEYNMHPDQYLYNENSNIPYVRVMD